MTPNLQVDFFLNNLAEDLKKLVEDNPQLATPDKAFGPWGLMLLGNVPADEAIDSFVDGGGDKGLDVIYVPDGPGTLVVLQAKRYVDTQRNLPQTEIAKTLNGARWLLNGDLSNPTVRPAFRARAQAFREALTSYFPNVEIYIVCTCQGPADDGKAEIEMFLHEANTPSEPVFSVSVADIGELIARSRRALQETTPNEIILEFSKPNPYEHGTGDTRALVGSVSGRTIAELFDKHGNAILEANVRNYLGNVEINQEIERTASDPTIASRFWFFNNGISLVCAQYSFRSQADTSRVRLVNAQIVNGCQTVHSLWHAFKNGTLRDDVEVLVRIIEQPDPEFVPLVTRYNNSQNAVRSADLVGRDPIQIRLKSELDALGYYYETRRGDWRQYFADRDERIAKFGPHYSERVIRLKQAAQACAAFYLQQPVIAKNNTALLTTPKAQEGLYEDVFDAAISAERVMVAVELMRKITAKRVSILDTGRPASLAKYADWLPHADFYMLALFSRQFLDPAYQGSNELMLKFMNAVIGQFDSLFASVAKRIGSFVAKRDKEPGYSHPRFFKTESSWHAIQKMMGPPGYIII
jgi:hypothetical protein